MSPTISQARFAKAVGVAKSTISRAVRGPLAPALDEFGAIHLDHPAVAAWCAERDIELSVFGIPGLKSPAPPESAIAETALNPLGLSLEEVEGMTLRELTDSFGSDQRLHQWVKVRKELAHARRSEHELAETQGALISREFVRTHLFGLLEELSRRLLTDAARTITRRIYSAAKAGTSLEEAEQLARELISQNLRKSRDEAKRRLREQQKS